jgi:GWxTD domain-containing protein
MKFRKKLNFSLLSPAAFVVAIFSISFFCSCFSTSNSVTRQNFSGQYHPDEKILHPDYCLYNVTDSLTRLFFSINSADLLYTKNTGDDGFSARISISYIVHPIDYSKIVVDSGHVVMSDAGKPGDSKLLAAAVDMDVIGSGNYYLEVTFRDLNKATNSYELLYLDHRGKDSPNNFLVTGFQTPTPIFKNYVDADNEIFAIHYYKPEVTRLFVRYFKNKSGPALPPYSYERKPSTFFPDSTFWWDITPEMVQSLPKEGWYLFNTDTISTGGLMLAHFNEGFPKVTVARQLVYPLRYLTMHDEYVAMDTAKNSKKAVDNFWLNNSGSEERARTVIRDFYNRVEITNELFSTQAEGWKSDRGMIYIIFGPPENVYKTASSETWIYGNSVGPGGLTFVFDHRVNAYSDNDFVLERNEDYKVNWITAVDSWRQGHVYTLR